MAPIQTVPTIMIESAVLLIPARGSQVNRIRLRDELRQSDPKAAVIVEGITGDVASRSAGDDFATVSIEYIDEHGVMKGIETHYPLEIMNKLSEMALTRIRHDRSCETSTEFSYVLKASSALGLLLMWQLVPPNSVLGNENEKPLNYDDDHDGYELLPTLEEHGKA